MAVGSGLVAIPDAFVTSVTEAAPENVALAPLEGALNVTVTPVTGLPDESATSACSGLPKLVPTVVDCGVPLTAEIVAGIPVALPVVT